MFCRSLHHDRMIRALMILMATCGAARASADVFEAIGPFVGEASENFEGFSAPNALQSMAVLGQAATINNLTEDGALKIEFSSSLNGNLVTPRSGSKMAGQLGIAEWVFDQPPASFGGYFATNSGADDAVVTFFDAQNQVLGQDTLHAVNIGNVWTWNGWSFDVPVHRLEIDGNGLIDGFIWYEDMQLISVPEPAMGMTLLVLAAAVGAGRGRRGAIDSCR